MKLVINCFVTYKKIPVLLCSKKFKLRGTNVWISCIIPRSILNQRSTLLLKIELDLLLLLYFSIYISIMKHNILNKDCEDFCNIYFIILKPTISEIDTLNEKTSHVNILCSQSIFIINIYNSFNIYPKIFWSGCFLIFWLHNK